MSVERPMKKARILLNWDTSRKDLLEPFISLRDDLEFIIVWGEDRNSDALNHPLPRFISAISKPHTNS
jgi:hypothetical protein